MPSERGVFPAAYSDSCASMLTAPKIDWFIIFQPLRLPSIHPFYILANLVESLIPACSHSSPCYHRAFQTEAAKKCYNSTCIDDKFFQSALHNCPRSLTPTSFLSNFTVPFSALDNDSLGPKQKGNQKCHPPPGWGNLRFCCGRRFCTTHTRTLVSMLEMLLRQV